MNSFEKFLYALQVEMETPKSFAWFHILCIVLTLSSIVFLFSIRKKYSDRQLKLVLGIYGIIALILEILKQLMWSFNYDAVTLTKWWDYNWYAAPFQFCTTPIFISIICLFLKKSKIRDSLLAYMAFFTILGSLMTILLPDSCFTSDILINIHTMFLHCGSFVVSVYILFTKEIEINYSNFMKGFLIFIIFVILASILNISFYNLGIIGDETFNMFYISPYFITHLPVYEFIQTNFPYIFYLFFYLLSIYLGGNIIYLISLLISKWKFKKC